MFQNRVLIPLACALALFAGSAAAQQEIKFGHSGGPGSILDRSAQEFAQRANAKLGTKAKVVVYGASQLGGDVELMNKLKLGTVDLALPGTVMSSQVPAFGLFEMPYLVRDREHMARIREQVVMPILAPAAEQQGYRVIAVWENGFRHITNNRRPIVKPEDLQGIKLRVPEGEWRVKMFQAYGASPTPLAFSKVYAALLAGEMDGQENPFAIIYPARLHEVQKYLSLTGHVYTPAYLTAGASWSRLDPDVQKTLIEAAKETEPVALKLGADLEADFLKKLRDAGIQINEADKDAFVRASDAIYRDFSNQIPDGKVLIEKALALRRTS